ncbi:MAG: alpha/beta hydrolase [Clostridiales bacterium]|nr:alpha/beta hydrolase [Candidatus Equinaster intestinalis]
MIIAVIAVLLILAVLLTITYICYRIAFYVSPKLNKNPYIMLEGEQYEALKDEITQMVDSVIDLKYTDCYTTSFDGYRLRARYYEVDKNAPLEIMVHGYKSIALRDYCGSLKETLDRGINVLLVDQRAHGESEGRCLSFGILERYDCLSWARFAYDKFGKDKKIILVGVSMGAATVLMASELELPENVVGIIADSGYSSAEAIIKKVIGDMKLPVKLAYPFAYIGAKIFGRFNLRERTVTDAVKNCKIPVMIVHGADDRFVPCEMCKEIYEACTAPKILLTVKEAGHGLSFLIDNNAYNQKLDEFLEMVL